MNTGFLLSITWGCVALWMGEHNRLAYGQQYQNELYGDVLQWGSDANDSNFLFLTWEGCLSEWADPSLLCPLLNCSAQGYSFVNISYEPIGRNWTCFLTVTQENTPCADCTPGRCGLYGDCVNGNISYECQCHTGYKNHYAIATEDCVDVDECSENATICGSNANCTNTAGGYTCSCNQGYQATVHNTTQPSMCSDIDECVQTPKVCGSNTNCSNTIGSYSCSCIDGYIPAPTTNRSTGCIGVDNLTQTCDKTDLQCLYSFLNNTANFGLTPKLVANVLNTAVNMLITSQNISSMEIKKAANTVLANVNKLTSSLVIPTFTNSTSSITTKNLALQVFTIGPNYSLSNIPQLIVNGSVADIDLVDIAKKNKGSGSVAFISYNGIETLLSTDFFYTDTKTTKIMMSNIFSTSWLDIINTTFTQTTTYTIRLKSTFENVPNSTISFVWWNDTAWIDTGDPVTSKNSSHVKYTSTKFGYPVALIMQIHPEDTSAEDEFMYFVNIIAVSVGLLFLALALLTFICCKWNIKVNNTARINLCICLFSAHLLFLLVQTFLDNVKQYQVVCAVLAGILHFLFLSSFVWMFLESLQLFLLVCSLKHMKVIEKEGLHKGLTLLAGYGSASIVVAVSASVSPQGYGSEGCWLKDDNAFNWSFLGPVCFILWCNCILFVCTIATLKSSLQNLNSEVSQTQITRTMVMKALLQSVIFGLPWILGFFTNSTPGSYVFLIFVSQQGTFIFVVHCLLNRDVMKQYKQWWRRICPSAPSKPKSSTASTTVS